MIDYLLYCICGCKLVSIINGKEICRACRKPKMPIQGKILRTSKERR